MLQIRRIHSGEADLYRRVRLAALADAPHAFCSSLEEASQRTDASWEEQAESTASGTDRATYFVIDQDAPVGLAAIYRDQEFPKVGHLLQVWLSSKFRGCGAGKQLVNTLLDWASRNRFEVVETEVLDRNDEIIPFYLALGFIELSYTENRHRLQRSIIAATPESPPSEHEAS